MGDRLIKLTHIYLDLFLQCFFFKIFFSVSFIEIRFFILKFYDFFNFFFEKLSWFYILDIMLGKLT